MNYSLIIPIYNEETTLEELLIQLNKLNNNIEIIIVNDGSTSIESINYLEKIEGLKSINFISQKNSGLSAARNKGIESISSDYILPLDADDLIHPCLLEILIKEMKKTKNNNKIAFSNWASFGEYKRMIKVRQPTPYTIRYTNYLPVTVLMPTQLCLDNKYDENMIYDDKTETDWNGNFHFEFLRKGNYTIYTYVDSTVVNDVTYDFPVFKHIYINKNNLEFILDPFIIKN